MILRFDECGLRSFYHGKLCRSITPASPAAARSGSLLFMNTILALILGQELHRRPQRLLHRSRIFFVGKIAL
jgi:hypothetical protein